VADVLLDLLAPPTCAACRAAPPPRRGEPLCAACRRALPWLADPCPRCALPRPCPRPCPAAGAAFSAAWAPWRHEGPARALVLALKDRGTLRAAEVLAAGIVAGLPDALRDPAAVVPVPADPLRRRGRGVDHAGLLAELVGRRLGLPVSRALARRPAPRHAGRDREARRATAAAVLVARRTSVPGRVLLVDDVHTTGATLDASAALLRGLGALRVDAVSATRTPVQRNWTDGRLYRTALGRYGQGATTHRNPQEGA
jgi:predicted amidophosphoribosyltransferase